MTLDEFVNQNNKYARSILDDMRHRAKVRDEVKEPEQWRKNLERLYNNYYILLGYIRAAYEYKHISSEEIMLLERELITLLTGLEG